MRVSDASQEGTVAMYLVISCTRQHGKVIRPGLSLVQAYRLLGRLGHGAIFRETGLGKYSRPVYPRAA
jgi:hypothetical protein